MDFWFVETIAFPIIRRAIQHGGGLASFYTPERMCTFMGITYDAVKRLCNDIGVGDTEAEFCVYISNAFSKNR